MAWKFFLSFEVPGGAGALPIQLEARVSRILSLSMTVIFAFGFAFELPVILVLLTRVGILSSAKLIAARRYAIVLIFIAAAIFDAARCFQPAEPRFAAHGALRAIHSGREMGREGPAGASSTRLKNDSVSTILGDSIPAFSHGQTTRYRCSRLARD